MLRELFSTLVIASTMTTAATAEPPAVKAMADPQMGDHWTYAKRDEITGKTQGTLTQAVTEVQGDDVSVRGSWQGTTSTWLVTFDRQWNVKENLPFHFLPNDGMGIRTPLAVGQTWTADAKKMNMKGEQPVWSLSRTVTVVGRSTVTTKAGQFDAFEIVHSNRGENVPNSGVVQEDVTRTWYVPEINHWVKRVRETRMNGYLTSKTSDELVEYGRREGN